MVFLYRNYNVQGDQVYAYISVRMDKINEFKNAMRKETFNLADYGNILASGYGDPTPEVMLEMEKRYGITPGNYMDMAPYMSEEFDKTMYEYYEAKKRLEGEEQ